VDREERRLCALRNIDGVVDIRAAVSIFTVSDYYQRPPALCRAHLFVAELPDGVIESRFLAGFLDGENCAIQQLESIGKVLPQGHPIVEGGEEHAVFSRPHYGLNKVHRRLLLELQLTGS